MERNKLLKLASLVCSVFAFFQLVGILIGTVALIHWHSDKEFYRKVTLSNKGNLQFSVSKSDSDKPVPAKAKTTELAEKEKVSLADLAPSAVYFAYIKSVIYMVFLFLVFREFGKIIRSVQDFQTFRTENIQSFRKIGKYFLVIFLISGLHFISTGSDSFFSIEFETTPLILMLLAYILAEIFKEGHALAEAEKLTI
jgi:hypothetical protein